MPREGDRRVRKGAGKGREEGLKGSGGREGEKGRGKERGKWSVAAPNTQTLPSMNTEVMWWRMMEDHLAYDWNKRQYCITLAIKSNYALENPQTPVKDFCFPLFIHFIVCQFGSSTVHIKRCWQQTVAENTHRRNCPLYMCIIALLAQSIWFNRLRIFQLVVFLLIACADG